jgi:DNA invertase Pin-like site-specific DNA recombinase
MTQTDIMHLERTYLDAATSNMLAISYCRVSDTKQKLEGSGLESQAHRNAQFATQNNLTIEKVFYDDVSGGGNFNKRPAMNELLDYVKANKHKKYVLILDDIKRISRDVYFYWGLIRELDKYGVQPMSPNFVFADTPEGRFQQSITVAAGEYERESIARQTKQKTKARLEAGFHAFIAPIGFKYEKAKGGGKVLVKDEPIASVITEMMEGFASSRIQSKAEAKLWLEENPDFPKGKSGKIGNNQVNKILNNPLYAGYIEYKPWGVTLRKGQHEGMVDYATFQKIAERMAGKPHTPAKKNLHEDFPLRNAIACECGNSLTAAWSKSGTGKRYAYYVCQNRSCRFKGKSIPKAVIEGAFEDLLKSLTPSKPLILAADAMFKSLWERRGDIEKQHQIQLKDDVQKIEAEVSRALTRIMA